MQPGSGGCRDVEELDSLLCDIRPHHVPASIRRPRPDPDVVVDIGAVLGSVFTSARSQGLIQLPVLGMIAISGIFYPITSMPEWLQWVAQASPIYWLGLGMRSALLPDAAVGIEMGRSWRHLETAGLLGTWAVLGMVLAPIVLRRMARRESGSRVAERREKALQRIG